MEWQRQPQLRKTVQLLLQQTHLLAPRQVISLGLVPDDCCLGPYLSLRACSCGALQTKKAVAIVDSSP